MMYVELISKMSGRYGSLLIQLMDYYHVNSLGNISEEQAENFYKEVLKSGNKPKNT